MDKFRHRKCLGINFILGLPSHFTIYCLTHRKASTTLHLYFVSPNVAITAAHLMAVYIWYFLFGQRRCLLMYYLQGAMSTDHCSSPLSTIHYPLHYQPMHHGSIHSKEGKAQILLNLDQNHLNLFGIGEKLPKDSGENVSLKYLPKIWHS